MNSKEVINIQLEKDDYETLEKIGKLRNRKNEDIAKAMLETIINWVGKEIIERLEKKEIEINTIDQKEQTNSFPHFINFQKIPHKTNPNDIILSGTVYLKTTTGYGKMCFDSCKHFPNNSQKCKNCIVSGLNDEYTLDRLLGYDLEISIKK